MQISPVQRVPRVTIPDGVSTILFVVYCSSFRFVRKNAIKSTEKQKKKKQKKKTRRHRAEEANGVFVNLYLTFRIISLISRPYQMWIQQVPGVREGEGRVR